MKTLLLSCLLFALLSTAYAQVELAAKDKPTKTLLLPEGAAFAWKETVHDFGKVKRGTPVSHVFSFTNKGKTTMAISSVQASCGCTVTQYTQGPIEPGSAGKVTATYNAATVGIFNKTITVHANTAEEPVTLIVKGEVSE